MKRFTKLFMTLALLCVAGSVSAKTEKVHATFESPTNTQTTWTAATKTFTWSATSYNQLRNIGLPTGDISNYKKLVVDCKIKSGEKFRILFYKGSSNITLWAEDGVNEYIIKDVLEKENPNEFAEYIKNCTEICLSGSNQIAPGEAVINDVYLETYDDEGEKVYATFESPTNTQTTWTAATKTFTWSATSYNQLRNIGLPTGDISNYKKLVVDCKIKSGEKFRILFYKGSSNITLWAEDGVNEYIIKDVLEKENPNEFAEYIKNCTEICLSGSNQIAPGEAVINSVYLETYPENESVELPEIVYEEDPGRPTGTFVDFTTAFPELQPKMGLGTDNHPIVLGNGDPLIGSRGNHNVIADLSNYSKLTIVTTPGLKILVYLNHEIDSKNGPADYTEEEAGKYNIVETQADDNGIIEVDLTQFDKQNLNCICLPWDNNNKGTVWYLLLTEATTVPVKVGSTGYATFSSTKAVDFTNSTIKAYTAIVSGKNITFTRIKQVPANTGVLLWGDANATDNLPILASGPLGVIQDNLVATATAMDGQALAGKYILAEKDGVVGFYKAGSSASLAAGKAYLVVPAGARIILPDGEVTGITAVETAEAEAPVYNLQGQRVVKAVKGVNIKDGKKFIVR